MCVSVIQYVSYGNSSCCLETIHHIIIELQTQLKSYIVFCISDYISTLYVPSMYVALYYPQKTWEEKQLIQACKEGDLETVKRLSIQVTVPNVCDVNWPGSSLVHHAARLVMTY